MGSHPSKRSYVQLKPAGKRKLFLKCSVTGSINRAPGAFCPEVSCQHKTNTMGFLFLWVFVLLHLFCLICFLFICFDFSFLGVICFFFERRRVWRVGRWGESEKSWGGTTKKIHCMKKTSKKRKRMYIHIFMKFSIVAQKLLTGKVCVCVWERESVCVTTVKKKKKKEALNLEWGVHGEARGKKGKGEMTKSCFNLKTQTQR